MSIPGLGYHMLTHSIRTLCPLELPYQHWVFIIPTVGNVLGCAIAIHITKENDFIVLIASLDQHMLLPRLSRNQLTCSRVFKP